MNNVLPKAIFNYLIIPYLYDKKRITDFNIGFYELIYLMDEIRDICECFQGACLGGHLRFVKLLLKKIDKRFFKVNWAIAIQNAGKSKSVSLVKFLIKKAVKDRSATIMTWSYVPFEGACEGGHPEIVKLIMDKMDKHELHRYVERGLYGACKGGNFDLIKMLLASPPLSGLCLSYGLWGACERGDRKVIDFILDYAEKTRNIIYWGYGFKGACQGCHRDIIDFIIERHAQASRSKSALTQPVIPLHLHSGFYAACEGGHLDLVKELLSNNPEVGEHMYYRLTDVCRNRHDHLVEFVIENITKGLVGTSLVSELNKIHCEHCHRTCQEHLDFINNRLDFVTVTSLKFRV